MCVILSQAKHISLNQCKAFALIGKKPIRLA
jgi:hypothetical protein